MLDDILAGIGGALEGGLKGYALGRELQQKDRAIDSREEIARLRDEIRLMIASMNEGGRMTRHETPSGNVVAQQEGATERTGMTVDGAWQRAVLGSDTTRRGQDITRELGILRDTTQQRGQDFNFDLGVMRNNTTRELGFRRDDTTRRGQDITQQLGISAEAGRGARATDANQLRREEMRSRERINATRNRDPWGMSTTSGVTFGGDPAAEVKETPAGSATGKPTAQPIEVKETTGTLPVAPRSPEAATDQLSRLEQQAAAAIEKFKVEKDPAKQEALKNDLRRLREEILKARSKNPGAQ